MAFKSLTSMLTVRSACVNPQRHLFFKYWFGHETLEDKMEVQKEKEANRTIKVNISALQEKTSNYAVARIKEEASTLGGPRSTNFTLMNFFSVTKEPILSFFTDYEHHMFKKQKNLYKGLIKDQVFIRERLIALGPDLSAAMFLCYRNCRVRFKGHDHWTGVGEQRQLESLPDCFEPGWYIEAIDASQSTLIYEGLQNMRNLLSLRYLDLSYCPLIDAWCIDRITGEYQNSLEYLDLSGCPEVDWNALEVLWRLKNLKTLVLYDLDHIKDLPMICLMLLEVFPNLDIKGVEYIKTELLIGTEHEYLLKDLDNLNILPLPEGKKVENCKN